MAINIAGIGSWLRYGVDFTGGSLVQVQFQDDVSIEELRAALGGVDITRFGEVELHEFVIRAPLESETTSVAEVADDDAREIEAQINGSLPGRSFEVVRTEAVGAKVGGEL